LVDTPNNGVTLGELNRRLIVIERRLSDLLPRELYELSHKELVSQILSIRADLEEYKNTSAKARNQQRTMLVALLAAVSALGAFIVELINGVT
jgi:hypothetical protein